VSGPPPRLHSLINSFLLDRFADDTAAVSLSSVFRPRQMYAPNTIEKVTSGGSTVCAVSSMGDVFSFSIPPESTAHTKRIDLGKSIKVTRIWSLRRRHMAVRDVAVGQDETVIISTESGSVWTRIRRAKPKVFCGGADKEFKFARVGTLTRVVAVRANSAGAYAAIRNDVQLKAIEIERSSLEDDLIHSIPLGDVIDSLADKRGDTLNSSDSEDVFTVPHEHHIHQPLDGPWIELFQDLSPATDSCDVALVSRDGIRFYAHNAILACRSPSFRKLLVNPLSTEFKTSHVDAVLEVSLDYGVVAIAQLVHYIYTDRIMNLPENGEDHKSERLEMIVQLRSLATKFDLKPLADILSSSSYIVLAPQPTMRKNLKSLKNMFASLARPDAILCLADKEVPCHSFILAARCPFFETMLDNARMGGGWLASRRRKAAAEGTTEFRIQLKHLSYNIMSLVLEHIYYDAEEEIFDSVRKGCVDEFLEFVIEVLAVANELLLDRLKDVCQSILVRFGMGPRSVFGLMAVTLRNVATILEEAEIYAAEQLKDACIDYCALNIEALLENRQVILVTRD
jgi:inhibitor of Bruton tyrosine kinase